MKADLVFIVTTNIYSVNKEDKIIIQMRYNNLVFVYKHDMREYTCLQLQYKI